ncbi:MAG TPA: helix-turn-helix transcriptional regulator [Thermoanaerobaculia bacterium]|nr:helix-turn-helix transcriptional regulator [Thermoanaerobaculia bacterium]
MNIVNLDLTTYQELELEDARGLRQEELIVEVTEALARALRISGLTKSELATRLGRTKGFVSQIMGGGRNLTLRTLADMAAAIGCRVRVNLIQESSRGSNSNTDSPQAVSSRRRAPAVFS